MIHAIVKITVTSFYVVRQNTSFRKEIVRCSKCQKSYFKTLFWVQLLLLTILLINMILNKIGPKVEIPG